MRHRAAVAALFAVAAAATVYLGGGPAPSPSQPDVVSNDYAVADVSPSSRNGSPVVESGAVRVEAAATELRKLSSTFRNSTFLIAIRENGFYCEDVVAAHESTDGVWLASCAEKLGYTLTVRDVDEFDVRPVAHYFDSVTPSPQLREQLNRSPPPAGLELERLRQ